VTETHEFQKLPIREVVDHLILPDGNGWIGRDQYIQANEARRTTIRGSVARRIRDLLVSGVDGNLSDGAIQAEHIGNTMWHLMGEADQEDELKRTELPPVEEPSSVEQRATNLAAVEEEDGDA
jgi:hypothetical protein